MSQVPYRLRYAARLTIRADEYQTPQNATIDQCRQFFTKGVCTCVYVCVCYQDIKMGLFLHTTKFDFFCLMYSPICLLYPFIQDFVQKAPFSEIQAIRSGWGNYV